ncbi:MAG: hypothetical protein WCD37_05360 [Chloroflexia bacterium]
MKHKNRPVGKPDYAPLLVAATALAGYLLIFLLLFNRYGDLRDFIFIGKQFIARSDSSAIIKMDPGYAYLEEVPGYDGQFAYFIALDPLNARYYVDQDRVSYRYTRILYPMLARSLVLGDPGWIPLSMVLVNLLAVTGGTFAVALWCRERRLSPWLGLVFAFYIGQVVAFSRDLNEILAYSLVAVAVYLFDHVPQRPILAALCFGLSALARETTLLFALVYIVALWARTLKDTGDQPGSQSQRWAKVASFGALAIGPAVLWQLCLLWWLGDIGWRQGTGLYLVPFANLYKLYPLDEGVLDSVEAVVIPSTICLAVCLLQMWRSSQDRRRKELWVTVLNAVLFVLLLPPDNLYDIYGSARIATPVLMGAIYSLPYVRRRLWFPFCTALWIVPTLTYLLNPAIELIHPR